MIPPPTPVPRVTMTRFLQPLPAPSHISPRAATFASFPTAVRNPVSSSASRFTSLYPQPRLAVRWTIPSSFTGAGIPIPIPRTRSLAIPLSLSVTSRDSAISGRIASPSLSVLVGISHLSTSVPSVWNRPILTVVPPISTPKQNSITLTPYFFLIFSCTRLYSSCAAL